MGDVYIPSVDIDGGIRLGPTLVTSAGGLQLVGTGVPLSYLDAGFGASVAIGTQYYIEAEIVFFGTVTGSYAFFTVYQAIIVGMGSTADTLDASPSRRTNHTNPASWSTAATVFAINGAKPNSNLELRVTPIVNGSCYAKLRPMPRLPWSSS